jgi:hypothetical protein
MAFDDGSLKTIADRAYNDALPMLMKEETKTTAGEAYNDRKYADGAGAGEDFRSWCYFLFYIFVRVCLM